MVTVGDFEIEGVLGEGGSAIVYAARRRRGVGGGASAGSGGGVTSEGGVASDAAPTLDRGEELALKVLRPELLLSERESAAFLEEAHRAQRVRHPSLVEIQEAGMLPDGRPYLVMPRIRGECLAERVKRGPFAVESALRLFRGLAEAIETLHAAGLVHRDIKPENVFVEGAEARLVLLDLGIARDIDAPASTTTQAGLVRGTPAYMAPERFFGTRASALTDTYEAAVLLYVMLTGRLPWEQAQEARGRMSPRDPRTLVTMAEPLAGALLRALSIDDRARQQGIRELVEELEHAAISTADTTVAPVLGGATPPAPTLPSPGVVRGRGAVIALSAPPPAGDFATQDTVALSTGRVPRKGRGWGRVVGVVSLLAGAGAAVGTFGMLRERGAGEGADPGAAASSSAGPASAGSAAGDAIGNGAAGGTAVSGAASATGAPAGAIGGGAASGSAQVSGSAGPAAGTSAAQASAASTKAGATSTAGATKGAATTSAPAAQGSAVTSTAAASSTSAASASAAASGVPGAHLADCTSLLGLYCSPAFKATDGGTTCSQWSVTIHGYRSKPQELWTHFNDGCRIARQGAVLALAERQRQLAAGKGPQGGP